jgi:hypothetical protein
MMGARSSGRHDAVRAVVRAVGDYGREERWWDEGRKRWAQTTVSILTELRTSCAGRRGVDRIPRTSVHFIRCSQK